MGFSSWKTADTQQNIMNEYYEGNNVPRGVSILLPGKLGGNIKTLSYDGYSRFTIDRYDEKTLDQLNKLDIFTDEGTPAKQGVFNIFELYFAINAPELRLKAVQPDLVQSGIDLYFAADKDVYKDKDTGQLFTYQLSAIDQYAIDKGLEITPFNGDYQSPVDGYGNETPNSLIKSGQWSKASINDYLNTTINQYPLKFSFNPNAHYDELLKSDLSQGGEQGFWMAKGKQGTKDRTFFEYNKEGCYRKPGAKKWINPHIDAVVKAKYSGPTF